MSENWILLKTQTAVTRMHADLLAHGWCVDIRHKDIRSIPVGLAGRARKQDNRIIVEEAIDDLSCIRTVYK